MLFFLILDDVAVPCLRRAAQLEVAEQDQDTKEIDVGEPGDDDGWTYTHSNRGNMQKSWGIDPLTFSRDPFFFSDPIGGRNGTADH